MGPKKPGQGDGGGDSSTSATDKQAHKDRAFDLKKFNEQKNTKHSIRQGVGKSAPVSATNPPWRQFKDVEGKKVGTDKEWVDWRSTPQSTPPGSPRGASSSQSPGAMFASDDAAGMAMDAASSRGEKAPGELFAEHAAALTKIAKQE